MDKSNETILNLFSDNQQPFLTDLTKAQDYQVKLVKGRIKVKRKPTWDEQRAYSLQVSEILDAGSTDNIKQAERIRACANMLEMGWVDDTDGNPVLKLKQAYFCRVRHCPVCQWRRAKKWTARFFEALPRIFSGNENMRFIFLTLTVQNCPVSELRSTVQLMSKAWDKMSQRKKFPALGFVRSLEVTKEKNLYDKTNNKKLIRAARPDYCHPHFHVLMAVPSTYFNGRNYLSKDDYAEMWQQALKSDYKPVCDVRIVKPKQTTDESPKAVSEGFNAEFEGMKAALVEVVKYTVKPSDMVQSTDWLLELVKQLHKTRAVSLGGIFKQYLKVDDEGQLITKEELKGNEGGYLFRWRSEFSRYRFDRKKPIFDGKSKWGFYRPFDFFECPHFCLLSPRAQCRAIRELGF